MSARSHTLQLLDCAALSGEVPLGETLPEGPEVAKFDERDAMLEAATDALVLKDVSTEVLVSQLEIADATPRHLDIAKSVSDLKRASSRDSLVVALESQGHVWPSSSVPRCSTRHVEPVVELEYTLKGSGSVIRPPRQLDIST